MEIQIKESESKRKKKMVAFELDESWYYILKSVADEDMISVSNLIRKIIYKNCIAQEFAKLNNVEELEK